MAAPARLPLPMLSLVANAHQKKATRRSPRSSRPILKTSARSSIECSSTSPPSWPQVRRQMNHYFRHVSPARAASAQAYVDYLAKVHDLYVAGPTAAQMQRSFQALVQMPPLIDDLQQIVMNAPDDVPLITRLFDLLLNRRKGH